MNDLTTGFKIKDALMARENIINIIQEDFKELQDATKKIFNKINKNNLLSQSTYYIARESNRYNGYFNFFKDLQSISEIEFKDEHLKEFIRLNDLDFVENILTFKLPILKLLPVSKQEEVKNIFSDLKSSEQIIKYLGDVCEQVLNNSDAIINEGLAEQFSKFDRRFRSHTGICFGGNKYSKKVIFNNAYDTDWNRINFDRQSDFAYFFNVLNYLATGKIPETNNNSAELAMAPEGIELQTFKNGNIHIKFTSKKLLEELNKRLAAHYGEVLGHTPGYYEQSDFEFFEENQLSPYVKDFAFYATPIKIKDHLSDYRLNIDFEKLATKAKNILEPSAGEGGLLDLLGNENLNRVDAIEIDKERADKVANRYKLNSLLNKDFLQHTTDKKYDLIVMNPPFNRGRDIDHVMHAYKFLAPGGELYAIMSAGAEYRNDNKAKAFQRIEKTIYDLPKDLFNVSVNTILVKIKKKG